MKTAMIGLLVGAGLMIVAAEFHSANEALAQRPAGDVSPRAEHMFALTSPVGNGAQQVTVIDPQSRVMGVYHVDSESGRIALKSIRNIQWDLRMEEFNGVSPSPRDIHSMLQRR